MGYTPILITTFSGESQATGGLKNHEMNRAALPTFDKPNGASKTSTMERWQGYPAHAGHKYASPKKVEVSQSHGEYPQ